MREFTQRDFEFVNRDATLHDKKFDTKPIGYYKDAWLRFKRNQASVVAACIIIALVLFAIVTPFLATVQLEFFDARYANMVPKSEFLSNFGIATGEIDDVKNERGYLRLLAIGAAAEDKDGTKYNHIDDRTQRRIGDVAIKDGVGTKYAAIATTPQVFKGAETNSYRFRTDLYNEVGFEYVTMSQTAHESLLEYEQRTGIQIVYPMIDSYHVNPFNKSANVWYHTTGTNNFKTTLDADGNFISIYLRDDDGNVVFEEYMMDNNGGEYTVRLRVLYKEYFVYVNGFQPEFLLGTNPSGQDLLIRLAVAIRTSLMLAIVIVSINLFNGTIYGSIAGYYGGRTDMIMERVREILGGLPMIIIVMLFKVHFLNTGKVGPITTLILAFVVLGWLGAAGLVRRQFYRFKSQEYVLAARTLGAGDLRIMFRHIFPNGIGTIITGSVLSIPAFVFSEASLSYLGILDVSGPSSASLGAMLSTGQAVLANYPHVLLWPSIVIILLMLSFNLFGNGLRDAFNPTLRGSES